MAGHKILGKNKLTTSSASLVTIHTLIEDNLGKGLLTNNYVVGIDVWLVTRATAGEYIGYVKGVIGFARNGGVIEGLVYSLEKAVGAAAATISVADDDPNVLVQITPGSSAQATHRIWLELRGQDDTAS